MQNLNIAVYNRVWPDFYVWRMSNWGMGYMPLKHFPLGFICVEVLWPSQPNGVMSSAGSLPNHMFTGQA